MCRTVFLVMVQKHDFSAPCGYCSPLFSLSQGPLVCWPGTSCWGTLLSDNQGCRPAPALARTVYDRPLPGKFCFMSVQRSNICCKTEKLETYSPSFWDSFQTVHRNKSGIFYKSLASFKFTHTHYPAWALYPPRETRCPILIYKEIKANKGCMTCPRSWS